jgi:hypothetical protein
MLLNPKHESRGLAGRNPKQGSKFEIQMFKTKSKTQTLLNALAIRAMRMTGGQKPPIGAQRRSFFMGLEHGI